MIRNGLDKLITLFCVLVFVTYMANHGHIDFSAVDWVRNTTVEAVESPEGQQAISETKDISKNLFLDIIHAVDRLFCGNRDSESKNGNEAEG